MGVEIGLIVWEGMLVFSFKMEALRVSDACSTSIWA